MLPSFSHELRVVLCPDKAILLGLGNGLRRKVTHQMILPCAAMPGAPAWRPALAALERWLSANKIGRANVTVILSNHFVRYILMPFSADVNSREEEQALAQILLENTYGVPAKHWHLKISGGGYGEPSLVAAVDAELPEAITKMMAPTSLRLTSIRPYLMSVFNGFYKQLREKDGLFAVAEPGQVVMIAFNPDCPLGHKTPVLNGFLMESIRDFPYFSMRCCSNEQSGFKNGQLFTVRRMPLDGEPEEQLPDLLQREALIGGLDAGAVPVYLHVAGKPDFKLPPNGGMAIHSLSHVGKNGMPLVEDTRFEMAVAGECA